jgi:muramoyltetrapeptide carboxypeptidase
LVIVNKPAPLKPGGVVGVAAPAGWVDEASLQPGLKAIRAQGYNVELAEHIFEQKGYLAGTADQRARDLERFFRRSDIDAIFCARGGFGSIQLLPLLVRALPLPPKIFIGYSDITVLLNWLLQNCRMVTFHAPMVAMDLAHGLEPASSDHFWDTLNGQKRQWTLQLEEAIRPGRATAQVMGGCLSMLVTTLGTPYEIDTCGKFLFLEDVGEKPYRIERMLTHLKMAGKLEPLAGVLFGDFAGCEGEEIRSVREVITEMFADAPYPVLMGMRAGHGKENFLLPFGVEMALDGYNATLSLIESPVA